MFKVAFRVDGGKTIGMGHIIRCLSLAKQFRKQGYKVYFISKYELGIKKVQEENFEVILLKNINHKNVSGYYYGSKNDLISESKDIINIVKNYKIDILFIDTYNVSRKYFLNIKPYVRKLVYIDDINKFVYPVDILINGNITGEYLEYEHYSKDEKFLLGPKYNLIRDEFVNLPIKHINLEVKKIMITTGGSDQFNLTSKYINILLKNSKYKNKEVHVIVGSGFNNKEELKNIAYLNSNIILHYDVKYISKIMMECDVAISSGGSTLYELCACGTPTIAFIIAENQRFLTNKMEKLGYIKNLGWHEEITNTKFINALNEICDNYKLRKELSKKSRHLVDGKGTERIVAIIKSMEEVKC